MRLISFNMRLFNTCLVLFICLVFSSDFAQTKKGEVKPQKIKYYLKNDIWPYAVLKFDANDHKGLFKGHCKPSTVSIAEINDIEAFVKQQVAIYNKKSTGFIAKPEKYFKQFIAVIDANGEKVVWVNCMCEVMGDSWKKTTYIVFDGGSCYFQLKINLTKRVAYDFYTNGLA